MGSVNKKPNSQSIRARGLRDYLNDTWPQGGAGERTSYEQYSLLIQGGASDSQIALWYGQQHDRSLSRQAVGAWRRVYSEEQRNG